MALPTPGPILGPLVGGQHPSCPHRRTGAVRSLSASVYQAGGRLRPCLSSCPPPGCQGDWPATGALSPDLPVDARASAGCRLLARRLVLRTASCSAKLAIAVRSTC